MSYMRYPYYIYGGDNYIAFNGVQIPNDQIAGYLADLVNRGSRGNLADLLREGTSLLGVEYDHHAQYLNLHDEDDKKPDLTDIITGLQEIIDELQADASSS